MKRAALRVACVIACAAVAGCASSDRSRPAAPARPATVAPVVKSAAPSASDYVGRAGSLDLFVLRSSELALQRASSAKVREVARSTILVHQGTSAQLAFASRRLGLAVSPVLQPSEQQLLDQLQSSVEFDRTYAAQQKRAHRQAFELHQAYAAGGTSPTLKPVASFVVTRLRDHQRVIDSL
jgi:putative membrane protein